MTINFDEMWPYELRRGSSPDPKEDACMMDAVSWFAYGRLGDHPECASPGLSAFCREGQDAMPHATRQWLKPFIFRLIGSLDPEAEERRVRILVLAAARRFAPIALEAAGLQTHATTLRNLPATATFGEIQLAAEKAVAAAAGVRASEVATLAARVAARSARVAAEAEAVRAGWSAAVAAAWAAVAAGGPAWNEYIDTLDEALNAGRQGDFDLDLVPVRLNEFALARSLLNV